MEAQLAAYRAKKARERQNNLHSYSIFKWFRRKKEVSPTALQGQSKSETEKDNVKSPLSKDVPEKVSHNQSSQQYFDESGVTGCVPSTYNGRLVLILKILLWLVVWGFFVEVGFGAVFFVVSLLMFVYYNTRTGPKRGDAPSAYSVFNKNCERLEGTFTAEQFEKELRYGALSVH